MNDHNNSNVNPMECSSDDSIMDEAHDSIATTGNSLPVGSIEHNEELITEEVTEANTEQSNGNFFNALEEENLFQSIS